MSNHIHKIFLKWHKTILYPESIVFIRNIVVFPWNIVVGGHRRDALDSIWTNQNEGDFL